MITTLTTCSVLAKADPDYRDYVNDAIEVAAWSVIDLGPDASATGLVRLEVLHTDQLCQIPLADAFLHVIACDPEVRFVEPDSRANYVSYWHRDPSSPSGWGILRGERSSNNEVSILGQTLPAALAPAFGAGYLHYMPNNGWTVDVGIWHPGGFAALAGLRLDVVVSARPYWNAGNRSREVLLPS